jgi:2-amino-1-hydroxyethylphosphonate dioxygenase (glycine-forming)
MPDDTEIIVAALLHDIGHIIGQKEGLKQMGNVGISKHEEIGADFATEKLGLPERIGKLIKSHVNAKRFLCW